MLVSKEGSLFKLFLSDIGLLTYKLLTANKYKILNCKSFLNYGAIYEAVMAQELIAHGFQSYYNNDKKRGEIDFLIELNNKVISIEVIFGKDYKRHSVLNQLVHNQNFDYQIACVLCNKNGKILYLPIYMIYLINNLKSDQSEIINLDISKLV